MVTRRRSCMGKHWHRSSGSAEAHLRALQKVGKAEATTEVYPCRFCLGWHVGRRPLRAKA